MFLLAAFAAFAGSPALHARWGVAEGLPVDGVSDVLVSADGFVWVATWDGLARFDGTRFEAVAPDGPWPSRRVAQIREAPDGAVWAQTDPGALVRVDPSGALAVFDVGPMRSTAPMALDEAGRWLVASDTGIHRVDASGVVRIAADHAADLAVAADGKVWGLTDDGDLFRIDGDTLVPWTVTAGPREADHLEPAADGWWIGTPAGVWHVIDHGATPIGSRSASWTPEVRALAARADGLWVGTREGLFRWSDGVATPIAPGDVARTPRLDFLEDDALGHTWVASAHVVLRDGVEVGRIDEARITRLAVDRFGTAWVATAGAGLHQVVPARIDIVSAGVAEPSVYAIGVDAAGAWWVGTTLAGVDRIGVGEARHYGPAEGIASDVRAVLADRHGTLWLGTGLNGLLRRAGDAFVPAGGPTGAVHALLERADGTLLAGASDGLWVLRDGAWALVPGVPAGARALAEDAGGVWVGTTQHGVWRLDAAGAHAVPVGSEVVRAVLPDGRGGVWAGTEDGGMRHSDGRTLGIGDGLPARGVHTLVADGRGAVWGSTNRGLFRVEDLDGDVPRIGVFAERDGLVDPEANGGTNHAAVRLPDGRLLFATQGGIAVVDPATIAATSVAPPVRAVAIALDGERRPITGAVTLAAAERSFGVDVAVLGLRDPGRGGVWWRFEGVDDGWVRGGARRTAWYTDVAPGTRTLRLRGAAADGTPSPDEATVRITVLPFFWETWPFRIAVGASAVGGLAAAMRARIAAMRRREQALQALVAARTADLAARTRDLAAEKAALEASQRVVEAQAARIAEVDRLKTRYFANLSHELRTPLTLLLGPLEDVREGRRGAVAPGALLAVSRAERSARGLFELVNQLLDVVKIDAGQLVLQRDVYDLAGLVRTAAAEFAPLAERQGIRLDEAVPPGPIAAEVDVRELRKVLGNLLSNAIKFTPRGGEVHVGVTADGDAATVTVRDTGIGISPDGLQRIFDRFYVVDGTASGQQPGTGLGLALTREIVELHGGTLAVSSVVGQGTTFSFTLATVRGPVRAEPDPVPAAAVLPDAAPVDAREADERTTVLVVDDHADLRRYIAEILAPRYRVIEASDGLEALATTRRELPDLVVCDVMMPGMDGHDLVRALRADPDTGLVPIVLLSARGAPDAQIEGLARGADVYLVKPFSSAVLRAQIDGLVDQRLRLLERLGEPAPPADAVTTVDERYERVVRELIARRHTDPEFGVAELADAMHQDRAHLFRRVKALTGHAPSDLLRQARLEHAARLLAQRAGNMSEVAYAAGFASLSYFSQAFRDHYGVAPSKYAPPRPAPSPTAGA
jgi:signal transduction histidine kinase/DNA-binding response OmpR family regulator/ligand-binding sensor domain-containing protein